jgi:hypothetical protein
MGAPVSANPALLAAAFAEDGAPVRRALVLALDSPDKVEAESAARTLKKIAEADRDILLPLAPAILKAARRATDVRVQWNLTIVLGRMPLKGRTRSLAIDLLFDRLEDPSGLNRTFALQALIDLSANDRPLRQTLLPVIDNFAAHGTPAMQARARRILRELRGQ